MAALPERFAGGAFAPGLPQGKAQGELAVAGDALVFTGAGQTLRLPLRGIAMRQGGAGNRFLFFTHPEFPDCTFQTADQALLGHPALAGRASVRRQAARLRLLRRLSLAVLVAAAAAVAGALAALWLGRERIVEGIAAAVPASVEARMGEALLLQVRSTKTLIEEPRAVDGLRQLAAPLLAALPPEARPQEFRFYLVKDPAINAFAAPGGIVVVNSGLIQAAGSPEEVAGVLAHEIAHVTRRHGIRQLVKAAGLGLAVRSLLGDVSGVAATLVRDSAFLLQMKYSRDFEREADRLGWDCLLRANLDPRGFLRMQEKLGAADPLAAQVEAAPGAGRAVSLVSTHPPSRERIETLRQLAAALPPDRQFYRYALDFKAFQAIIETPSPRDEPTPEAKQ